jgi:hypothetical protein
MREAAEAALRDSEVRSDFNGRRQVAHNLIINVIGPRAVMQVHGEAYAGVA